MLCSRDGVNQYQLDIQFSHVFSKHSAQRRKPASVVSEWSAQTCVVQAAWSRLRASEEYAGHASNLDACKHLLFGAPSASKTLRRRAASIFG